MSSRQNKLANRKIAPIAASAFVALVAIGLSLVPAANAQSEQGTEHACPPGTTEFSRGQCTVTTTTDLGLATCPVLTGQTGSTGPSADGKCTSTFSSSSNANRQACTAAGGTFSSQGGNHRCSDITAVCPQGGVLTQPGNRCVETVETEVRPGQGNQP